MTGKGSNLEALLAFQLTSLKVPAFEREYQFAAEHVGRGPGVKVRLLKAGLKNWRLDFAWPDHWLAVEVEGGGGVYGRHNRPAGFIEDMWKYHHVMRLGWVLYRCNDRLIKSGDAADFIHRFLEGRRVEDRRHAQVISGG